MFKWVSWVIRMGATALLLSFLCIWTTGYIVNSYMESVVKGLDLPIEIQPIAMSGVWGTLWGADKKPKAEAESTVSTSKTAERESAETGEVTSEPQHSQSSGNVADKPSDEPEAQADPGVLPGSDGENGTAGDASPGPDSGDEGNGSVPAFNGDAALGQLTDADRQALYAMVVSKLNPEQLSLLSEVLKDGVTSEELTQVQDMLKSSLSEGEYSQMMELLQGVKIPDREATLE
ncbi:hypothetical protein [Cohnella herbarum]|uniref:Uncharacterized protein n=1 Tax=Cohnella herbarum TaxID=2728023 RepID=A0A7Z2VMD8_9BACL|nr:hypothetical protein [Cohnella herbarum]QJD85737.1 hypothetical protein HH215_22810 [Cohnella herbarum]